MDPDPFSYFLIVDIVQPFNPAWIGPLVLLVLLLLASGLISGSEVAFFSVKTKELEELRERDEKTAKALSELLESPKLLLSTILISNNFINVGIVIFSAYLTGLIFDFSESPILGFAVNILAITFLILLFGEVLPKIYATRKSLDFALLMQKPMHLLRWAFRPLSRLLVRSTDLIERRMTNSDENFSVDELSHALELTNTDNTSESEQKILEGIVKFGDTTVKQIMKPRTDIVSLDIEWDYQKVRQQILEAGYSRIPVYEENLDEIKGVLYIKDFIPHIDAQSDFNWQALIREAFFVPENKKIDDLLKEFQERKIHLAIVVDEFGGTSGIITLEDVIEEIVGDISDEFDDDELTYSKLDDDNFVFEGKIHLNDFFKVMNIAEETFKNARGDADTLAGFLLEISGKFPKANEEIPFDQYVFKVESLEGRRIKRIKVTRNKNTPDETPES